PLEDSHHRLLAEWAAECAEHVLPLFEAVRPMDPRPRRAVEQARAWTRGEITMTQARSAAGHANAAARELSGAARHAAHAAGQAAAVAHVAAHELGAAAYAIKAARAAASKGEGDRAGRRECCWQRGWLPEAVRDLVLDDQLLCHGLCWSVFDCYRAPAVQVGLGHRLHDKFEAAGHPDVGADNRQFRGASGDDVAADRPRVVELDALATGLCRAEAAGTAMKESWDLQLRGLLPGLE